MIHATPTFTNLTTNSSTTNATSYATASISATSPGRCFAFVSLNVTGTAVAPTSLTGGGLTWTLISSRDSSADGIYLFKGTGTPSAGAVTIDFGGVTQNGCEWSIFESTGINMDNPVVQAVTVSSSPGSPTTSVTMAAFSDLNNPVIAGIQVSVNEAITAGSGFTLLGTAGHGTPQRSIGSQYQTANDTSVEMNWTTGGNKATLMGVELMHELGAMYPQVIEL